MPTRRSKRQRDVGLVKDYIVRPVIIKINIFLIKINFKKRVKTHSKDGAEQMLSLRTFVYNEELPTPIVMTRPLKPRSLDSSDGDSDEDVYPGPVCTACAGVDNDMLVWCSGCGDPYHVECAPGYPKGLNGSPYRWLCQECRQQCVSCHDQITISAAIFKCKTCWRIIHRRCVDPTVRADYKQHGWPCFDCQRHEKLQPPIQPCQKCDKMPIKDCPLSISCKRCQTTISSCCLDLSSSVLQYRGKSLLHLITVIK